MAKSSRRKKKKNKKAQNLFHKIIQFFLPQEIESLKGWIWFSVSRTSLAVGSFFLTLTLIFSVIPIPFSAYMVQKKVSHFWANDRYHIQYRWVGLERIAWQMQIAVIAAEDQNFSRHFGLDLEAIETALKQNSKNNKKPRGASTITQQTVKNLYLWHGTSWLRKSIEIPLSLLVESVWDKSRILEIYLNIAEFGEGIFGVEAAARHYFNKSASQLSLQESALLAASLPNPFIFRVDSPNLTMQKKQQWIIRQIHNLGGKHYLEQL